MVSSIRPAGTPEPEAGAGALWARAAQAGASAASAAPAARMVMLRGDMERGPSVTSVRTSGVATDDDPPPRPAPAHQGGVARHLGSTSTPTVDDAVVHERLRPRLLGGALVASPAHVRRSHRAAASERPSDR